MSTRQTLVVTPTGVGRRDYSQDIQVAVEPLVSSRSHQARLAYSARLLIPTPVWGGDGWSITYGFYDEDFVLRAYVPDAPKVMLYDFYSKASQNALLELGMAKVQKMETEYDPVVVLEEIFKAYGYGEVSYRISKGLIPEPGYSYIEYLNCYTTEDYYYLTINTFGISDTLIRG